MDDDLQQQVNAAIRSYDDEAQWWQEVPCHCADSRHRLIRFVELECPDFLIEAEIKILGKKTALLQQTRLESLSLN